MTAKEKRAEVRRLFFSRKGKNNYTQGSNRQYFWGKPEGREPGYSDCSSSIRAVYKRVLGIDIGSNTNAQVKSKTGVVVDTTTGLYPNEKNLRIGDGLYFKGNAAHAEGVGHVELYIGNGQCAGHGSGKGPKVHNLRSYCKSRGKAKRYFKAIRWISDDADEPIDVPDDESTTPTTPMDKRYPVHGVIPDVSKYQGNVDWKRVASAVDFIIIRVQDNTVLDSKLARNIKGATDNDVPYALYAYYRAATEAEAIIEADLFYDRAMATGADDAILWYIDVEKKTAAWKRQRAAILAFADRLRERGAKRVGLYTFNAMYPHLKAIANQFDDVWIAHYGKNTGAPSGYPTHPCGLHQYTSMAGAKGYEQYAVPGIDARVDLNRLTGARTLEWYTGRTYLPSNGSVTITGLTVFIRSGPGKAWRSLGIARKGTKLPRTGEDYDGWIGITYKDQAAFVSAKYAKEIT